MSAIAKLYMGKTTDEKIFKAKKEKEDKMPIYPEKIQVIHEEEQKQEATEQSGQNENDHYPI